MTEVICCNNSIHDEGISWNSNMEENSSSTMTLSLDDSNSLRKRKFKPYRSPKKNDTSPGIVFKFPSPLISDSSGKVKYGDFHIVSYPNIIQNNQERKNNIHETTRDTLHLKTRTKAIILKQTSLYQEERIFNEDSISYFDYFDESLSGIDDISYESSFSSQKRETSSSPSRISTSFIPHFRREPKNSINPTYLGKRECASCRTKKTPYWRDGWDNVLLCNACGIRYQKYRVYCKNCHYIPRKEERFFKFCLQCHQ